MIRISLLLIYLLYPISLYAAGDLTEQNPIEVTVSLGNAKDNLRFYPDSLQFETGKLYKLVIRNPSKQKHYFSSEGLARSVFTRKVQVVGADNKTLVEVKGSISEIEVYPGHAAEWWFVPVKTLNEALLRCSIKGHTEAGMAGRISIK